ncbi:MAG TPA: hypothetical protein V6C90_08355 [Coleofasciculaceae cyanobacterium]
MNQWTRSLWRCGVSAEPLENSKNIADVLKDREFQERSPIA